MTVRTAYPRCKRLSMEAQERAYNSLSAGTQGGTTTSNINVQNRSNAELHPIRETANTTN